MKAEFAHPDDPALSHGSGPPADCEPCSVGAGTTGERDGGDVFPWNQGLPLGNVAAIDCGTNSIRLLIGRSPGAGTGSPQEVSSAAGSGVSNPQGVGLDAPGMDASEAGNWVEIARLMRIVRLGEGVDRSGELAPAAIARTVASARDYARLCRDHQVTRLRFVATSATRDARNRQDFVRQIRAAVGVDPEVVAGQEEARLSFLGATTHLRDLQWPVLVVDIGGGSTEFVYATSPTHLRAVSTNMGSVRVHEKFPSFAMGPDSDDAAARAWITSVLETASDTVAWEQVATLVAVAGTVTTVEALALGMAEYDSERLHGSVSNTMRVQATCAQMISMPVDQRGQLGFMPAGREDVIGAGAAIYQQVAARLEQAQGRPVPVVVSEYDILDGIALSLLGEAGR